MKTTLTIPTTSAIETAVKNAARDAKNYRINDLNAEVGMWLVVHKTDRNRRYIVDTNEGSCECEQFARVACCKHQHIVDEEIQIREMEQGIEDYDFLLSSSREHNVGFTAEVLADTYAGFGA